MSRAYYNEFDPGAAAWLRQLIVDGLIAPGDVDERSICDVQGRDLDGYTQVHFFAGIGGWSLALRLAGWSDDRPAWTGSCPCQPFSSAGKRQGQADERHLWPEMFRLIKECGPQVIFGEQVASAEVLGTDTEAAFIDAVSRGDCAKANKLARKLIAAGTVHYQPRWLDGVFADLESIGYACRANDIPAAGVGAPHIRQRLWWVADAGCNAAESRRSPDQPGEGTGAAAAGAHAESGRRRVSGWLGNADDARLEGRRLLDGERAGERTAGPASYWDGAVLIPCGDGKARRIEPGIAPLADGLPARVVRLRGYGNAICPQVAAAFIEAADAVIGGAA